MKPLVLVGHYIFYTITEAISKFVLTIEAPSVAKYTLASRLFGF